MTSWLMKESRPRCWGNERRWTSNVGARFIRLASQGAGGGGSTSQTVGEAWNRVRAICWENKARETQGKNRWRPNLGMKFPHGSLEVHQFGMKLWEPRSCSTYSVSSPRCERCFFFHGSFYMWSWKVIVVLHLHSRILRIVSQNPHWQFNMKSLELESFNKIVVWDLFMATSSLLVLVTCWVYLRSADEGDWCKSRHDLEI